MRAARWIAAAIVAIAALVPQASAAQVQWSLNPTGCAGTPSPIEIQCGAYGVFEVGGGLQESTSSCPPPTLYSDEPLYYAPPPLTLDPFPHAAHHLREGGGPQSAEVRKPKKPHPINLLGKAPAPTPPPTPPPNPTPWMAVIDFSGAHGDSTTALAGEIAGSGIDTRAADLDDPALDALGENVGDFHVLARLCEIAEMIDDEHRSAPLVVNMSFGRAATPSDPVDASCTGDHIACQIAKVIAHLRARNVSFVAAAGNHQQLMFPASLSDVLAAGMLDVNQYQSDQTVQKAWETPQQAEGLAPGNAICLDMWAIPAGSSYSSALLSGWLAPYLRTHPTAVITDGVMWGPQSVGGCPELAHGTTVVETSCNPTIQSLFNALSGVSPSICWGMNTTPSESVPTPDLGVLDPTIPSFIQYVSGEHASPESDPCVPCVGVGKGGGAGGPSARTVGGPDLAIDFSQSIPVPAGTQIEAVSLRVDTIFYGLVLTQAQFDALETGSVAELVLEDTYSLITPTAEPSLWFLLRPTATACTAPGAECYWTSTPVLLR
jgi:hypothetical protein